MDSLFPARRWAPLLAGLLGAVAVTWTAGCDFTRVDAGTDLPIEQHLEALATAATADDAEQAIRGVLNKVGVRTSWQADVPDEELAFGTYFVSDAEIEAVAEEHAQFVAGRLEEPASIRTTHEAVVVADNEASEIIRNLEVGVTPDTRGEILVNADESAGILRASVATALATPDTPASAMVLAIAADGATPPTASTRFSADRALSPAQRLLFSIWLHHNGPFMFPFLSRDLDALPVIEDTGDGTGAAARTTGGGTKWHCNTCCDGSGKFTSMTLLYVGPATDVEARILSPTNGLGSFKPFPKTPLNSLQLFSVDGSGRPARGRGLSNTLGNEVGIYVGQGTKIARIHTSCSEPVYPGMMFGSKIYGTWYKVLVVAVATQENGLCSNLQFCVGACKAQLIGCKLRAGDDAAAEAACEEEFRSCDLNCHDQGGIY